MGLGSFLGIAAVCAAGPLVGFFIGRSVEPELVAGERWLLLLQQALFGLVVFFGLLSIIGVVWSALVALVLTGALMFSARHAQIMTGRFATMITFAILAILFSLSAGAGIVATLVFLCGLPTGSLVVARKRRIVHAIVPGLLFIALTAAIYLVT